MDDIRTRLTTRLAELEARAGRLDNRRRSLLSADSEEQALETAGSEVVDALDESTRQEMDRLRAALARMDAGTYGMCEVCDEPIAPKRLLAMPYATRCLEHADEA